MHAMHAVHAMRAMHAMHAMHAMCAVHAKHAMCAVHAMHSMHAMHTKHHTHLLWPTRRTPFPSHESQPFPPQPQPRCTEPAGLPLPDRRPPAQQRPVPVALHEAKLQNTISVTWHNLNFVRCMTPTVTACVTVDHRVFNSCQCG